MKLHKQFLGITNLKVFTWGELLLNKLAHWEVNLIVEYIYGVLTFQKLIWRISLILLKTMRIYSMCCITSCYLYNFMLVTLYVLIICMRNNRLLLKVEASNECHICFTDAMIKYTYNSLYCACPFHSWPSR